MKKQFSQTERFAVFTAHGGSEGTRCWLCREPVDFVTMEVDHILPESLLDDTAALSKALTDFGLPTTFDLNSYGNWLPAHRRCNGEKKDHVFRPTPIIQLVLDRTVARAAEAEKIAEKTKRSVALQKAIGTIASDPNAPSYLVDQLLQFYGTANTSVKVVGSKVVGPGGDAIGMMVMQPVFGYVPPRVVKIAPGVTALYDQTPVKRPGQHLNYTYKTDD